MAKVKIIMAGGKVTEIPEGNLENFKRLNGSSIEQVVRPNQSYDEILAEIEDEEIIQDAVDVTDEEGGAEEVVDEVVDEVVEETAVEQITDETPATNIRMTELLNSDLDVLIMLGNEIAEKKGDSKFTKRNSKKTVAEYIMANDK